jgi:hypothetical protein
VSDEDVVFVPDEVATEPDPPRSDRTIRYMVNVSGAEDFIMELPSNWRLTFGYVNPARSSDGYNRGEAHCLRVWEGQKLRAVYGNIIGFRDLSIPLARKVTKETGSAAWTRDSQGNFEGTEKRERQEEFLLLDAEVPEF